MQTSERRGKLSFHAIVFLAHVRQTPHHRHGVALVAAAAPAGAVPVGGSTARRADRPRGVVPRGRKGGHPKRCVVLLLPGKAGRFLVENGRRKLLGISPVRPRTACPVRAVREPRCSDTGHTGARAAWCFMTGRCRAHSAATLLRRVFRTPQLNLAAVLPPLCWLALRSPGGQCICDADCVGGKCDGANVFSRGTCSTRCGGTSKYRSTSQKTGREPTVSHQDKCTKKVECMLYPTCAKAKYVRVCTPFARLARTQAHRCMRHAAAAPGCARALRAGESGACV